MTILGKKQMSEEDIKLNYITPVILKGWKGHITMETKITDGRINIRGNIVARSKPKFADYMLLPNGKQRRRFQTVHLHKETGRIALIGSPPGFFITSLQLLL